MWALRTVLAIAAISVVFHAYTGDPWGELWVRLAFVVPVGLIISWALHRIVFDGQT